MAYVLGVRRYHRETNLEGYDVAVPDEPAFRYLVCAEDGDEETLRGDTVLGVFGSFAAAQRWLQENGGSDASR